MSEEAFAKAEEEAAKEYDDIMSTKSEDELTKAGAEFYANADEIKWEPEDETKSKENLDDEGLEEYGSKMNKDQAMSLRNRYNMYITGKYIVNTPKLLLWARRPTTLTEEVEDQNMFA